MYGEKFSVGFSRTADRYEVCVENYLRDRSVVSPSCLFLSESVSRQMVAAVEKQLIWLVGKNA